MNELMKWISFTAHIILTKTFCGQAADVCVGNKKEIK